jgi:hypothetical protein
MADVASFVSDIVIIRNAENNKLIFIACKIVPKQLSDFLNILRKKFKL